MCCVVCVARVVPENAVGMATVWLIPGQGKREVVFRFRYDGVQNIHATIDDTDELDEMHEDNNHAYSLLFQDIANSGYTLQTLRLDPAIAVSPVVASGLTIGYQVKATVLGDTFTRANVLVQLWHGSVGGDAGGRLIGTVLVARVSGPTTTTTRFEVKLFWDTRNPSLFGKIRYRCDRCVYAYANDPNNDNRAAYDHCCEIMEAKDDVHTWFETTHFHAAGTRR